MNPLDELLANLDPDHEPEDPFEEQLFEGDSFSEDDLEEEEDDPVDIETLMKQQTSLAKAIANHYHRQGVIPDPDPFMSVDWELEMGPEFAEAQAEANAKPEGADSSAPDASIEVGFAEAGSAESGGSELGAGDIGSGDMGGPDFGGGDFGGFGGGGL